MIQILLLPGVPSNICDFLTGSYFLVYLLRDHTYKYFIAQVMKTFQRRLLFSWHTFCWFYITALKCKCSNYHLRQTDNIKKTYSHTRVIEIYNTIFIINLQCSQHMQLKKPEEITGFIIILIRLKWHKQSQSKNKYFRLENNFVMPWNQTN